MDQVYRVLICEFHQESNTFNPLNCSIEQFEAIRYLEGEEFFCKCRSVACAVHGMIDAVEEAGGTPVPTIDLFAQSGGRVKDEVMELLLSRLQEYVEREEFDAVFTSLHGATSTESEDDACGVFMEKLRDMVDRKSTRLNSSHS